MAVLATLLGPSAARALDPIKDLTHYCHETWSTRQGLPHGHVQAVLQTADGYLWVGTEEGVARFDGARFTTFDRSNTPALLADSVSALCEDNDGTLWIGTAGGVASYRHGQFHTLTPADGLPDAVVRCLHAAQGGGVWVGTGGGLARVKDGRVTGYTTRDGLPNDYVWAVTEDAGHTLWAGTAGGLCRFDGKQFTTYTTHDGLPGNLVRALYPAHDGGLWVGTAGGLARWRDGRFTATRHADGLSHDFVKALYEDAHGVLWVGTNGGLDRLRDGRPDPAGRDLFAGIIVDALAGDEGEHLWVGTNGQGLHGLRDGKFSVLTTRHGLAADTVWTVYHGTGGATWLGTQRGLTRLTGDTAVTLTGKDGLSNPTATALAEGPDGSLWVGTLGGGLNHLKDGKVTVYGRKDGLGGGDVRCLAVDGDGGVWAGTVGGGLSYLKDGRFRTYTAADGLPHNTVHALLRDQAGDLWIGTGGGGLARFHDGQFTTFGPADGLAARLVFALHQDAAGTLWLATDRGLLARRGDAFTACPVREHGFNGPVFAVLEDAAQNLWLTSNKGICRIARSDLDACLGGNRAPVPALVYTTADGLKTNELSGAVQPAAARGPDGKLWFATYQGVAILDPARVQPNETPPTVKIERALLNSRDVAADDTPAVVPPGPGQLEFHYTGLCFDGADRVRFRYRLEGFDSDWLDAGNRRVAYYTNIPPGSYRFRVRACNADGFWDEGATALAFELRPHFYQTWWFYGAGVLAVVVAVLAAHVYRIRSLKQREQELARRVDERTAALRLEIAERCRAEERLQTAKEAAEEALTRVKQLHGLLPICCYCKRIRDDKDYWQQVESYLAAHTDARFTHGICPECFEKALQEAGVGTSVP